MVRRARAAWSVLPSASTAATPRDTALMSLAPRSSLALVPQPGGPPAGVGAAALGAATAIGARPRPRAGPATRAGRGAEHGARYVMSVGHNSKTGQKQQANNQ